jgi:hypothetical protein
MIRRGQPILTAKEREYIEKFANPYEAARHGFIDDVIEPRNTRFRIIRALQTLMTKKDKSTEKAFKYTLVKTRLQMIRMIGPDFSQIDGFATTIAIVGYLVVFIALVLLYFVFYNLPSLLRMDLRKLILGKNNKETASEGRG